MPPAFRPADHGHTFPKVLIGGVGPRMVEVAGDGGRRAPRPSAPEPGGARPSSRCRPWPEGLGRRRPAPGGRRGARRGAGGHDRGRVGGRPAPGGLLRLDARLPAGPGRPRLGGAGRGAAPLHPGRRLGRTAADSSTTRCSRRSSSRPPAPRPSPSSSCTATTGSPTGSASMPANAPTSTAGPTWSIT